jgi:hypothetical protein
MSDMPKGDNAALDAFLDDFVRGITDTYPDKIDCILLSGSAARGGFKIGESDIDLHIILKDERDVAGVERFASSLFWGLNRRHGLKLVRSYGRKLSGGFSFMLGQAPLAARPFYVAGPKGWRLKLHPPLSLTSLLGLERELLRGRIRNGKVLFGRNILDDPEIREIVGKRRHLTYDFLITLCIQPLFIIVPSRVLKRCANCIIFTFDDRFQEIRKLSEMAEPASGAPGSLSLAVKAFRLKADFEGESAKMGILGKLWFCIRTPPYILLHTFEIRNDVPAGSDGR